MQNRKMFATTLITELNFYCKLEKERQIQLMTFVSLGMGERVRAGVRDRHAHWVVPLSGGKGFHDRSLLPSPLFPHPFLLSFLFPSLSPPSPSPSSFLVQYPVSQRAVIHRPWDDWTLKKWWNSLRQLPASRRSTICWQLVSASVSRTNTILLLGASLEARYTEHWFTMESSCTLLVSLVWLLHPQARYSLRL